MSPSIKYITFKDGQYAGFVVRASPGESLAHPVDPTSHMDRAVWLTGQLEAGNWGTVQSYDGAAMSGGLLHNIAVAPKDVAQATLFALLRECEVQGGPVEPLWTALAAKGWYVAQDGKLRNRADGVLVSGKAIRDEFTGPNGLTPPTGVQHDNAQRWALLFHALLVDPKTYKAQTDYAAKWLAQGNSEHELLVYRRFSGHVTLDSPIGLDAVLLGQPIDFAMCVYHCFSTNAPGIASQVLDRVWHRQDSVDPTKFATQLIRGLGTEDFGKWHDEHGDGANRYDRCRDAAMKLWTPALVDSLMPRDIA